MLKEENTLGTNVPSICFLLKEGIVKRGDSIVITSSSPLTRRGKTNFMKLHTVGK